MRRVWFALHCTPHLSCPIFNSIQMLYTSATHTCNLKLSCVCTATVACGVVAGHPWEAGDYGSEPDRRSVGRAANWRQCCCSAAEQGRHCCECDGTLVGHLGQQQCMAQKWRSAHSCCCGGCCRGCCIPYHTISCCQQSRSHRPACGCSPRPLAAQGPRQLHLPFHHTGPAPKCCLCQSPSARATVVDDLFSRFWFGSLFEGFIISLNH